MHLMENPATRPKDSPVYNGRRHSGKPRLPVGVRHRSWGRVEGILWDEGEGLGEIKRAGVRGGAMDCAHSKAPVRQPERDAYYFAARVRAALRAAL